MSQHSYRNPSDRTDNEKLSILRRPETVTGTLIGAGLLASVGLFVIARYRTAHANEILVRTGFMVRQTSENMGIDVGKAFVRWPFQHVSAINLEPTSYRIKLQAMSKEKMSFEFPAVFTIGPKPDDNGIRNYAKFMLPKTSDGQHEVVTGVIEGESRGLSATLEIEDIFEGRRRFKDGIVTAVQSQLDGLGLYIHNGNIEELKDSEGSNYFREKAKRIASSAENEAKIAISEQNKLGDIGHKEREADTRKTIAKVEADAKLVENERLQTILQSDAQLAKTRAEQEYLIRQAQIDATSKATILETEKQKEIEAKRLETETEKARAEKLSTVRVTAEIVKREAEGQADAIKILAEANLEKARKDAQALFVLKEREAAGIRAVYEAQGAGLEKLLNTLGNNPQALLAYMMIDRNMYQELAKANADAIKGLNPKITVWTNDGNKAFDAISGLGKSIVPLIDTIHEQTGYKVLPDWLAKKEDDKTSNNNMDETNDTKPLDMMSVNNDAYQTLWKSIKSKPEA